VATYVEVHPVDPQPRLIREIVDVVRDGGVIAYPTDSGYALGCKVGDKAALERIRDVRRLDDRHHFTLVCREFAQLGQYVLLSNSMFRLVKASIPGSYTFILPATREVPRLLLHPKKRTVGVRVTTNRVAQALLAELGEALLSSTLILPGETEPMTEGWEINERLGHALDAVVDAGECGKEPTTVVDLSDEEPIILRYGAGDPTPFE
jgi:tRNA threonylcarbamoyl adenosine modification protein (Sua5/YciO/YrdC/YwlC family)